MGSIILLLMCLTLRYGVCEILNTTSVTEGKTGCLVFQFPPEINLPSVDPIIPIYNKTALFLVLTDGQIIGIHSSYLTRLKYTGDLNQKRISFCIQNITVDDAGNYDIQIESATYTNVLQVLVELTSVSLHPSQYFELNESKSKVFKCVARSNPLAKITWNIYGSVWPSNTPNVATSYLNYTGNRSDHNNYLYCTAESGNVTVYSLKVKINIIYAPAMNPNVEVSPEGGIIAGNNVTLKCSTLGGNPLPVLSWNCSSGQEKNNTAGNQSSYSVTFPVNKFDNNKICACSATHTLEAYRPVVYQTLVVLYAPDNNLTIVQNPTDAVAQQNVTLTCYATGGNPLATLSWNCSGITRNNSIGNTATYSVEFLASKSDNNKVCKCSAYHTIITSYNATLEKTLTVFFPPDEPLQIGNGQESVVFYENRKAELRCKMYGGNPLANLSFTCGSYQGRNQSNITTSVSVLQFNATRILNGESCVCNATHKLITKEVTIQLQVYFPPDNPSLHFFPMQPLLEGDPAQINCNSTLGNPQESVYEWFLNGQLQTEQNTSIFVFRNVTKDVNRLPLYCNIKNNFTDHENVTRQSKAEILNVNYYPLFTMSERTVTVNETGTLNQTCNAVGNPQPDVQWFLNKVPVSQKNQSLTTLYIECINRSNAGVYECKANASSYHRPLVRSVSVEIIVNYAPDVHIEVTSSNLEVDGTANLTCVPNGIPQTYTYSGWHHKYQDIIIRTNEQLSHFQTDAGRTLVLTNITYQDMGDYTCLVKNDIIGKNGLLDQANTAHVLIKGPPIISGNYKDSTFTAETGHPLVAKFNFFTFPNVSKIQWYNKTSEIINPSTLIYTNVSQTSLPLTLHGMKVNVSSFSYQTCLILYNFQTNDEGIYMLLIKNQMNEANVSFRAAISGPPEPPFNIGVVEKSDTTVVLSWTPGFNGGNGQIFNVIYYASGYEYIPLHRMVADDNNKTQYMTITELQPSTTYIFKVFSSNIKGNSCSLNLTTCLPFNVTTDSRKVLQSAESSSMIAGVAAGISIGTVVIVLFVIVLFVRRRIISTSKDSKAETSGRSQLTRLDDNEARADEGLHDNILYQSVGSNHFRRDGGTEYAVVQKTGNKWKAGLKEDYKETALNTACKTNYKIEETNDFGTAELKYKIQDVYENVVKQSKYSVEDSEKTRNQDGLVYADLMFNLRPPGAKIIIHGLEDKTIYAEVDTTQTIDPLPDSDDEVNQRVTTVKS